METFCFQITETKELKFTPAFHSILFNKNNLAKFVFSCEMFGNSQNCVVLL